MNFFSNLSPEAFVVISLVASYAMTSNIDRDEELSIGNFLIIVGSVMRSDADQKVITSNKNVEVINSELTHKIVYLSQEVEEMKKELKNIKNRNSYY